MDGKDTKLKKLEEALLEDITERKKNEKKLIEREEELKATIESTTDGILVVNSQGKVINNNRQFAEMWRIPQSLISEKNDEKLLNYVLDQLVDPQAFLSKVQTLYKSLAIDFDTLFFKDGRVFERYSKPLMIEDRIAGRVWSFRDITERKKAEEEIKKKVRELEEFYEMAVNRELRMKELKKEIKRLEEKLSKYEKDN
ncbi:MAG: PAS domain-containing protein [Thermodesulfovibrionia bacterium]|nr:PAS domain-containing protein [Thermodesulfovibrionia bacterium]